MTLLYWILEGSLSRFLLQCNLRVHVQTSTVVLDILLFIISWLSESRYSTELSVGIFSRVSWSLNLVLSLACWSVTTKVLHSHVWLADLEICSNLAFTCSYLAFICSYLALICLYFALICLYLAFLEKNKPWSRISMKNLLSFNLKTVSAYLDKMARRLSSQQWTTPVQKHSLSHSWAQTLWITFQHRYSSRNSKHSLHQLT